VIKKLKEDSNVYEKSLKNAKLFYSSILHDGFQILPLPSWDLVLEIMERYRLLPNDALIAATCKHYGIKKIATFDEDFRRVDFLQVVEL
ncbi:MAG: putative ribonuclease VapC, partial [Archaeoglobus fulgidus]